MKTCIRLGFYPNSLDIYLKLKKTTTSISLSLDCSWFCLHSKSVSLSIFSKKGNNHIYMLLASIQPNKPQFLLKEKAFYIISNKINLIMLTQRIA